MFYHYVDTHVYKRAIGIDMEGLSASSWSYAYWVEPPTLQLVSEWNTSVTSDNNQLEYFGTFPTPSAQAFGDWATDLGVGVHEAEEPLFGELRFTRLAPNPFKDATMVECYLPRATVVRAAVYDVRGRLVVELMRGMQPAGTHVLPWDGTDREGRRCASGVYFLRLEGENCSDLRKAVIIK